jgi:hypothetical protein
MKDGHFVCSVPGCENPSVGRLRLCSLGLGNTAYIPRLYLRLCASCNAKLTPGTKATEWVPDARETQRGGATN